jgi:hypothetical protein
VSESYQDKKKASEEQFQAHAKAKPEETTPLAITAPINAFAAKLGQEPPRYVPVVKDAMGLYGWCNDGVSEKIKTDGGDIGFGWTIWEWPGILLTSEFHAVWVSPMGELIDITPKPHGETRIVFVPDPSYPTDFDFDKRPRNKRQRLYEPSDPSTEIAAHIARMTLAQRAYEEKRAARAGVTLQQSLRNKRPPDPLLQVIDDFIRVCNEYEKELDAGERVATGHVLAAPKLQALLMEKLRLQKQLKRSATEPTKVGRLAAPSDPPATGPA